MTLWRRLADPAAGSARVRALLVLEIERILEEVEARRNFLIGQWDFHRNRTAFLDTVFQRWTTLRPTDVRFFDDRTLLAADAFYREVEAFRRYAATTEDMFESVEEAYDEARERLGETGTRALAGLRAPGAPTPTPG